MKLSNQLKKERERIGATALSVAIDISPTTLQGLIGGKDIKLARRHTRIKVAVYFEGIK